ncbi:MAG: hypothetical protein OEQ13_06665, partial [Acidobacteriota bacterium]|nr:hypothetical protein [Acidobacteriota bacterium]
MSLGGSLGEDAGRRWPYPGLRPFHRDEIDVFFGRDQQVYAIIDRLAKSKFLAVVGVSGCGKSSLVRCGLLGGVEAGLLRAAGADWRLVDMRPGNQPLQRLARALLEGSALGTELGDESEAFVSRELSRGPRTLLQMLEQARLPERTNVLLLVDQFEEIFRFRQEGDTEEAEAFVDLLLETVREAKRRELRVYVVLTMRSDFLGSCALFSGLPEMLNDCQYLTPRLEREEFREAIEGPAAVFGGEIEPALVTRLLNDMYDADEPLPVMQHLLMQLWMTAEREAGAAPTLTVEHYEGAGGLGKALSNHADRIFESLDDEQQRVAGVMFRRLSEGDIRRPTRLEEVAGVAGASVDEVVAVAERFRDRDCSFVMPPAGEPLRSETMLDISHEALIRQWKKLREWSEAEAEAAKTYRLLIENARQQESGAGQLYREGGLRSIEEWEAKTAPNAVWAGRYGEADDWPRTEKFLQESRREVELGKSRRRRQRLLIAFVALVAVLGVLYFGWYQNRERRRIAVAAQELGKAGLTVEAFPQDSMIAALNAARLDVPRVGEVIRLQAHNLLRETLGQRLGRALEGDLETRALAAGPRGRWIATASSDRLLRIWRSDELDPRRPVVRERLALCEGSAVDRSVKWYSLAVAEGAGGGSDAHVAVGSVSGCVEIWRVHRPPGGEWRGTRMATVQLEDGEFAGSALALSPDGGLLAAVTDSALLQVWDLGSPEPRLVVGPEQGPDLQGAEPLVELTDGWLLTNWGLWRRSGGAFLSPEPDPLPESLPIQAAELGAGQLVMVDADRALWSLRLPSDPGVAPPKARRLGEDYPTPPGEVEGRETSAIALAATTGHLISGHQDGRLRIWDLATEGGLGQPVMVLPSDERERPTAEHRSVAELISRQNVVAARSEKGTLRAWRFEESGFDPARPPAPWAVQGQQRGTVEVELGAFGRWLVSRSDVGEARVWDTGVEGACRPPGPEARVSSIAVSRDSLWLARASSVGGVNDVQYSWVEGLPRVEQTCAVALLDFPRRSSDQTNWLAYVDVDYCDEDLEGSRRTPVCVDRKTANGCPSGLTGTGRLVLQGLPTRQRTDEGWSWTGGTRDPVVFTAPSEWKLSRALASSPGGGHLFVGLDPARGDGASKLGRLELAPLGDEGANAAQAAAGRALEVGSGGYSQLDLGGRLNRIVAASPDGRWVLVEPNGDTWKLRDFTRPGAAFDVAGELDEHPWSAVLTDERLVIGTVRGTLAVFDLGVGLGRDAEATSPVLVRRLGSEKRGNETAAHEGQVTNVGMVPERPHLLFSADASGVAYLWDLREDVARPRRLVEEDLPPQALELISFSDDGNVLVAGGVDGTVRVWDWSPEAAVMAATMSHPDKVVA